MSEFKFACPVCGQHMKCDVSQGGQIMECPTCFQKITAPHAPAVEGNLILTGIKVLEQKKPARGLANASAPAGKRNFPVALLVGVLVLAGGAALFVFRDKIFSQAAPVADNVVTNLQAVPESTSGAPPGAPPAPNSHWTLTLDGAATPDVAVTGQIHGKDFKMERATYQNGVLILRAGVKGPVEFGVVINFAGADREALARKTINVRPDVEKAAAVILRWKDDAQPQKQSFHTGYALRLEFGALAQDHLPGKIYLCLPDAEKSYLLGTFDADAHKPKPKQPKK